MSLSYTVASATPKITPVLRTRIFIGTQATSPTADAFIEIGGVLKLPSFGPSDNPIKTMPIGTGLEQTSHGGTTLGGGDLMCIYDPTDAAQNALSAAYLVTTGNYNFRMIFNDGVTANPSDPSVSHGTIKDIKVVVLADQIEGADTTAIYQKKFTLGYNSAPVTTSAT